MVVFGSPVPVIVTASLFALFMGSSNVMVGAVGATVSFVALLVTARPVLPIVSVNITVAVKIQSDKVETSMPVIFMLPEMSTVEFPVMLFDVLSKIR